MLEELALGDIVDKIAVDAFFLEVSAQLVKEGHNIVLLASYGDDFIFLEFQVALLVHVGGVVVLQDLEPLLLMHQILLEVEFVSVKKQDLRVNAVFNHELVVVEGFKNLRQILGQPMVLQRHDDL